LLCAGHDLLEKKSLIEFSAYFFGVSFGANNFTLNPWARIYRSA